LKIYTYLYLVSFFYSIVSAQPSLEDKIGQMLGTGISDKDSIYFDIERRNLGGVILFGWDIDDPQQLIDLTSDLQSYAEIPLFIATDQEGGIVARLDETNGFEKTYTAYQLGTIFYSEDSTRKQARKMAQWLYTTGINNNLAPVVDLNVNPASPAIGYYQRSFSEDPPTVIDHAQWFISEFANYNIIMTLKHFPGHGSAEEDSHLGFTDITDTWTDAELIPYRHLLNNGYNDMIMVGHLYNAHIDSVYPASLSRKTIQGLLRDSLGYNGVVVSDEMFMGAITNNYDFDEAIELAINAGTDMLLYRFCRYNGSLTKEFIDVVKQKVVTGNISESRIDESYARI
jgi:beta-N-acetylhexosaminidase